MSKKGDSDDNTDEKCSSRFTCGRDSNSKVQPQIFPTKLGEKLIKPFT